MNEEIKYLFIIIIMLISIIRDENKKDVSQKGITLDIVQALSTKWITLTYLI